MNYWPVRSVTLLLCVCLAAGGCQNMSKETQAALLGVAGYAVGKAAGMNDRQAALLGVGLGAVTYVLFRYQASQEQRHVAEVNARTALARMKREEAQRAAGGESPKPTPRYIAVDTAPKMSDPSHKSIMIFDTRTESVLGAGNGDAYDLKQAPRAGEVAKFDTVEATYEGS